VLIDSWLHSDLQVALIGPKLDLTYEYEVSGYMESVHGVVLMKEPGCVCYITVDFLFQIFYCCEFCLFMGADVPSLRSLLVVEERMSSSGCL